MLKSNVYSIEGKKTGEIELPEIFNFKPREDMIKQAFRAISLSIRQPYGSSPIAGMRRVGKNLGPNHGMSRIPRTHGGSRGVILASMVGGRSAHSPRTTKVLTKKINDKERKVARLSAISMTSSLEAVRNRGHKIPGEVVLPIVAEDEIQSFTKTKEAEAFIESLGLMDDVNRAKVGKKIRAGRGKMRGRRYKHPKSLLVVGTSVEKLRAFKSLPGVDIATIDSLSIRKLAPGGNGGRLTIFTKGALKALSEVK